MEYGLVKTNIGWCGVICTDRGVRNIIIGVSSRKKARNLILKKLPALFASHQSRSNPLPRQSTSGIASIVLLKIKKYASGARMNFSSIKLDRSNLTCFKKDVFRVVRAIPYGRTMSYKDVAKKIGSPKACRAVGRALARNPLPIIIPCHRVIGSNGELRGFSTPGGIDIKRKLLLMEGSRFRRSLR